MRPGPGPVPGHSLGYAECDRLRKNHFGTLERLWSAHMRQEENTPAGCSKGPDFSPAQPWRAETRFVPSKAAASEDPRRYPPHFVEPFARIIDLGERKIPSSAPAL